MASNSQKLELRQGQSLVMTPQLQQSLKLLQYSSQELEAFIEEEVEKNPLLLKEENDQDAGEEQNPQPSESTKNDADSSEPDDTFEESDMTKKTDSLDMSDDGEANYSPENADSNLSTLYTNSKASNYNYDNNDYLEQIADKEKTLTDHIIDQISLDFNDPAKKMLAMHMMDMLDDNGYISDDFSHLKELLDCDDKLIEEVLERLQKCDPPGVFARSLSECIELQLKEKNRFDPAMELLIKNLDLVADGNLTRLQKICEVDESDLSDMCKEIRELNPKPGADFVPEITHGIQADVFIRKNTNGSWSIELNNETLPKLLVNNKYYAEIKKQAKSEDEKKYVSEQFNTANWLLKTLNQRAETILKVATELVKQQEQFFEKGIYHLKPLVLRNIAEELDIHESTVARVTTNKYMSTSRGLYEMKFFFSSSISSSEGESDHSSKSVKYMISELVENETATTVLSDDKLAEILNEKGMNIARRTVAKYRESMKIPSSVQRRKQKKMQG